ncbi:aminopeptidase [Paenibacillus mucilaginosus]|uniref:Aminopeptidase n=2 Tax=Paenibacillus mucilaginosus TaxID=61624 RepID=I0BPR2_9BACL|nr:aminopeptidase [Paenibacillus mucilaginosus]AEI42441.1 peptidase M29 aminopeptidase II [Paenibacillus mucilaginosus KNP414]AFH64359.1 aminopeptidase [Paenibacillus mucilaginosus K02]MCG7213842.1 aminopeptidase [Paenibacillus mucilaginosus]WDM25851.1 aminopeptidase [Paenibacillus mucilaginosus]WFA20504.1 aminopeptidase [Paenibacillus mucilaginosus]
MRDPRLEQLARNLVEYSLDVQKGEKVLIDMIGSERELVKCLVEQVYARGGVPYVELIDPSVRAAVLKGATQEQIEHWTQMDLLRMKDMNCYIGVRAGENVSEMSDVPEEKMKLYSQIYSKQVHLEQRVKKTRWVVLRYPNASMAQLAGMSTSKFENFYFDVCNLDYAKMSLAMDPLQALMNRTDRVRIVGPGATDISFSIKGIGSVKCCGKRNIPDGEVYSAPVRDSVNGTIAYNTPSVSGGVTFENVTFRFEKGRIVEATANDTKRLNQILDTDEGARYIGEFSLGFNPHILYPMKDTLFDEKIDGSLHFTPGQAYEQADNGNRSSVHWDLVLIQRPEFGGGEIYFDDVLIRKDGRFVIPELEGLNPEHLK